jgi:NADH:ubiquinone oxidoreductase subunit F (NADH-binding)
MNNTKKIISKIKKAGLIGRSGSCFPVWSKWEILNSSKEKKRYIICNASEGELETYKDAYIIENYPEILIDGIKKTIKLLKAEKAFLYLNKGYFKKFEKTLNKLKGENIFLYKKDGGYIAGEETSIIEAIQGNNAFPRIKPPYPCESGLWGYPTLVHNVETFYCISKIINNEYENERFYSVQGDVKNKGVFKFKDDTSIKEILINSNNYPNFNFFLQVGGGGCGEIITEKEIDSSILNLGSIIVYDKKKTDPWVLMKKWSDFLLYGNCDKCVPCREGIFRINEMINKKNIENINDIFYVLENTSRCPLGKISVTPFKSLINKILNKNF